MIALLGLSRVIDRLNAFLGRLAAFLVLAAALISAGNAFIRYVPPRQDATGAILSDRPALGTPHGRPGHERPLATPHSGDDRPPDII